MPLKGIEKPPPLRAYYVCPISVSEVFNGKVRILSIKADYVIHHYLDKIGDPRHGECYQLTYHILRQNYPPPE